MPGRIQQEIQQKRPFRSLEEEALLNIERTADLLTQALLDVLKPHELTATQYNVLRILRGSRPAGLNCKEIAARMITRDPDITRLLDRLERRELLTRDRSTEDRRYLVIRITDKGLGILADLDKPVRDLSTRRLRHLGPERLTDLITLLEQVRTL